MTATYTEFWGQSFRSFLEFKSHGVMLEYSEMFCS